MTQRNLEVCSHRVCIFEMKFPQRQRSTVLSSSPLISPAHKESAHRSPATITECKHLFFNSASGLLRRKRVQENEFRSVVSETRDLRIIEVRIVAISVQWSAHRRFDFVLIFLGLKLPKFFSARPISHPPATRHLLQREFPVRCIAGLVATPRPGLNRV